MGTASMGLGTMGSYPLPFTRLSSRAELSGPLVKSIDPILVLDFPNWETSRQLLRFLPLWLEGA